MFIKDSALIAVDLQNDFCPGGALEIRGGDSIIGRINHLMPKFEKVVATQDWHPVKHVSFASSHAEMDTYSEVCVNGFNQILWPEHCIEGSEGAQFHKDFNSNGADLILRKGNNPLLDSYSVFFENDKITPTGLSGYLHSLHLHNIFIAGLATDFCVYFSALDALKLDFNVTVIIDCCKGVDIPDGNVGRVVEEMLEVGVNLIHSESL
jgi:nicotinamidase/pyrazinamidase